MEEALIMEVWDTFKQISKEPAQCLGAYVISMTSKASDILSVYFMQKQAQTENLLRVVPLFETLDDLKNAKSVMENIFKLSWYRKLINHKQEVMIGYSDSSKDAGKLSASWHQYKLQEELRNLANTLMTINKHNKNELDYIKPDIKYINDFFQDDDEVIKVLTNNKYI